MPHFVFTLNSEDEMQKSTHKYIQRYPKKSGDGWWYVYAQDLKKPFKALMTIFGLNKERISKDYENNNIQKDYGVNKDSFAAHILRYFTKREFYNEKFSNPDISKKFKKPVNEKKIPSVSKTAKTNPSDKPKWNNSLLRKIWSIYNPDAAANVDKKIEQMNEKTVTENISGVVGGGDGGEPPTDSKKKFSYLTNEEKTQKKEQLLNNIVASIPKDSVPYNGDGAYDKAAKDWINKNGKGNANTLIGEVVINGKSVERDLHHGDEQDKYLKLQTIPSVKDVLEKGTYLGYEKDFNGKPIDNHYFAGKINYGGEEKIIFCRVRENNGDKNRFYVHEVFTEEEIKKEVAKRTSSPSLLRFTGKPLYEYIIRDILNVNTTDTTNLSNAMIGNQNAKKDGITDKTDYTINGGNADEGNNNLTQQEGISGTSEPVQHGNTVGNGSKDVSETEHGNNGSELELGTYKPGIGLAESGSDDVNTGRGRVTKARARKIREQCREILKKSDDEITESDKEILRQYVGAGGTDEKDASNSGVLYEFYTPYNVINKIWQLVDKYNPKLDKTVIEPSSGIGRFAENRPEKFTMFELEEESARIAHILKPDATVIQGAFQKNFMKQENGIFTKPYEQFDVAVGNPPYGDYKGYYKGKGEGKDFKRYDSYFISRTIDTLKDGGILAMVIPQGMLNGSSSYGKDIEKIAGKAKLLEAWRLPNGTFDSTDVGTDIVIFRKESGGNANDIVGYFDRNPDHIAGEKSTRIGRFGEETYIKVKDGDTFESAVDNIPVGQAEIEKEIADEVKKVETEIDDKKTLSYGDEVNTPSGKGIITGFKKTNGKITGYIARVNGEKVNIKVKKTDAEKHRNRSDAMKGNKNAEGTHVMSPDAKIMTAAEFNQKYGKSFSTEDLPIWKATDKYGNVDISKLSESELEYVKKSENYVFNNGNYINKVNYASGNIRQKIKELDENDPQYEMKKSILESAMPETKHVGKLVTYYEKDAFGNDVKKNRFEGFTLSPITDWARDYRTKDGADLISLFKDWAYGGGAYFDESTSPITAEEIPPEISWRDILAFINREPVRLDRGDRSDNKKDNDRFKLMKKEKRQETAIRLFNRFLSEGLTLDDKRDLENAWNDNFNTYVNPDYTKIPIFVDGMSTHKGAKEFILTKQQINGVTQLTNKGTGLLAYDVGVGKTPTGIVATVNQIQTERAKRPLICVPKPVYKNWIKSIHQLFPEIKVNELGNLSKNFIDSDFVPEEGSISVCTYEGIENISFSEEQEEMLKNDVEFNYMRESKSGKESARSKASADEKNEETVGAIAKTRGEGISLAQLGFDHITVDEVHNFRNLFTVPRRIDIKGEDDEKQQSNEFSSLGSGTPSDRALKLFGITQVIQHENDGRNVFLLSATPFQNSPIEIYSILSYMARDKLRDMGIYSIEQFVSQFCKLQSEMVVKANKIDEKLVMKDFNNLSALQNLITEYIDKVDGEEAGVIRPYKRTHTPELEMTELQKAIMDECNDYIEVQESLPKNDRDPGYMFRAMNAMRNCTLSPALVSIDFIPDGYEKPAADKVVDSSPKLKFVCDSIIAQYKNNNSEGQVIYMPSGVEYFPEVRNYLVKHGVPKDAVALMSGGATSDKQMEARQNVMDDFNNPAGKTKIIIGSSAIKEGVNLQGNSTVIYNTQLDWNPTDAQQVEGRIWRQGNRQGITHVVYPLMSDSIDAMIYQKYDEKATRLDALYSYKGDELNVSDINPEELKFGLIKDPVKRARVMVSKYKEKAESEEKMYGQLYDVLYKQKNSAFENDESVKERVLSNFRYDNPVNYNWTPEVSESNISFLTEKKKEYEDMKKKFMKENKRDTFDVSETKSGKYDTSETSLRYEWRQGAAAYDEILKTFDDKIESKNELISRNRKLITKFNNLMKNEFGKRDTLRDNLSSKGIKTPEDAERKMEEYSTLRIEAKEQIEKSKDMYNEFLEQAIKDNETRKKVIPSLEKQIKTNIESIRNDLHPMDAEWKAKIKDENEKRFGIQKALFFRDGKLIFGLHF